MNRPFKNLSFYDETDCTCSADREQYEFAGNSAPVTFLRHALLNLRKVSKQVPSSCSTLLSISSTRSRRGRSDFCTTVWNHGMKIFPGSSTSSDSIPAPHRVAYHRLEVLRLASAHVAQVDLMVIPPTFKIRLVSLLPRIKFHTPDCLRLVVIGDRCACTARIDLLHRSGIPPLRNPSLSSLPPPILPIQTRPW